MLSLLTFSKNDIEDVLGLSKSLMDVCDQIVIIDSSNPKMHNELLNKTKAYKNIEVYYTLPLGYADPLRMYGLSKCKNEWILYLDTDERINNEFAKDIKNIIKKDKDSNDAFAIKRYEEMKNETEKTSPMFTWQIRLFKKDKVNFKGILHEQAEVNGRLNMLDNKYYIAHMEALRHQGRNYGKMSIFEVFSYNDLNKVMKDYIRKAFALDEGTLKARMLYKITNVFLKTYEKLTFKKMDNEISRKDYLYFYFIRSCMFMFRQHKFYSLLRVWKDQKNYLEYLEKEREAVADKYKIKRIDIFHISKIINEIGIIKYLGFDKLENIDKLTKNYQKNIIKDKGIDLLIGLIVEKYRSNKKTQK
jgi:hypothetical protein